MKTLFTNAARRRGVLYATAGVAALAFASPVLAQDSDEGEEEFPTTPIPDTTAPATGDVITVNMFPLKDGRPGGNYSTIIAAGGKTYD